MLALLGLLLSCAVAASTATFVRRPSITASFQGFQSAVAMSRFSGLFRAISHDSVIRQHVTRVPVERVFVKDPGYEEIESWAFTENAHKAMTVLLGIVGCDTRTHREELRAWVTANATFEQLSLLRAHVHNLSLEAYVSMMNSPPSELVVQMRTTAPGHKDDELLQALMSWMFDIASNDVIQQLNKLPDQHRSFYSDILDRGKQQQSVTEDTRKFPAHRHKRNIFSDDEGSETVISKRFAAAAKTNSDIELENGKQWVFMIAAEEALSNLLALGTVGRDVSVFQAELLAWAQRTASRDQLTSLRVHVFDRAFDLFLSVLDNSAPAATADLGD